MAKPGKTGLTRIIDATGYSLKGLAAAWKHEAAFRQEAMLVILLTPLAIYLAKNKYEMLWLLLPLAIIVIAELANSAIEAVVDRISDEHHELAGRAKDIGSAMVFIALWFGAVVWAVVLFG